MTVSRIRVLFFLHTVFTIYMYTQDEIIVSQRWRTATEVIFLYFQLHTDFRVWVMLIIEVTVKFRTAIKNWCFFILICIKLDNLSCSFTSITFLTNKVQKYDFSCCSSPLTHYYFILLIVNYRRNIFNLTNKLKTD
jgi:hypothetical protein